MSSTFSEQTLNSFSVAVGPGPTKELSTSITTLEEAVANLPEVPDLTDYSATILVNEVKGSVALTDGFLTNTSNVTDATMAWESNNVIVFAGLAAPCTLTGQAGANGLVIAKSGTRLAHFGGTPVVKPTVSGAKGSNAALASLMTALGASGLNLVTDSTSA